MITVFTILFVVCCLVLCVLILLQSSKGGLGAGLGGGGSQSTQVFGGQGAGGFLSRWTIIFSVAFMSLSLLLAHLSSAPQSILGELDEEQVVSSEEDEVIESGTLDVDPSNTDATPPPSVDPGEELGETPPVDDNGAVDDNDAVDNNDVEGDVVPAEGEDAAPAQDPPSETP